MDLIIRNNPLRSSVPHKYATHDILFLFLGYMFIKILYHFSTFLAQPYVQVLRPSPQT